MQIRVPLSPATHRALVELSIRERRDARDQAAVLLARALARRGLIRHDARERPDEEADVAHPR